MENKKKNKVSKSSGGKVTLLDTILEHSRIQKCVAHGQSFHCAKH